jgi:uncharacterized protein YqeY
MSLKEKIESDFISAYKAHDEQKVSVLRLLKSAIKNSEINEKHDLNDDEIIKILRKEVKQRQDAIVEYTKGNRLDLVDKDKSEIGLLDVYLPAQIDKAQIETIVERIISDLGALGPSDMGKVIGAAMKEIGNQSDGSVVSQIVREKLSVK